MAYMVTRVYGGFRGADFRGEEINLVRSPDCLNVYKDYKKTESIRTRPSLKEKYKFDKKVYGMFFYNGKTFVHSGSTLYIINEDGTKETLKEGINEAKSDAFVYNGIWYFKDGKNYLQYSYDTEEGKYKIKDVEPYIPTTSINRAPKGPGTDHEDLNLLTGWRINTFVATGNHKQFHLDSQDNDAISLKPDGSGNDIYDLNDEKYPIVTVNSEVISKDKYYYSPSKGLITFKEDYKPPAPETAGQANMTVKFCKTVDGYADRIQKCTILQVFDNRVFFSGNKDFPNTVWHCSLNDPSYCSDTDYYNEGLDNAAVKGLVAGNNALWVFREPSLANTTIFYHTPTIDSEYGKIYPNTHSSVAIGCTGRAINFNDDIVFFSGRGMEGISGDITTEQVVAHRSSLIDRKLVSEGASAYGNMLLEEWEGYLLVFIGNRVYLADSRSLFTYENHVEYEWFYWELEKEITCTRVHNGVLYLGTDDGIYTLNGNDNVHSYWVTPKDKFDFPNKLKTTNKRGCTVEAEGDITVFVKTEDGAEFEEIGSYKEVKDYFVSRIKKKKFKDIQLKFESDTFFSLETATLECFIGGYIKR